MSLRAIKKREIQTNPNPILVKQSLFKKSSTSPQQRKHLHTNSNNNNNESITVFTNIEDCHFNYRFKNILGQRILLGRATVSNPEINKFNKKNVTSVQDRLLRSKSENDVSTLLSVLIGENTVRTAKGFIGAKSEVCLKTITSHNYPNNLKPINNTTTVLLPNNPLSNTGNMLSGARSHKDLTQSSYNTGYNVQNIRGRRMSECSLAQTSSEYSQRTSEMSSSALTISSNTVMDSNAIMRVPIIGYEVMEERARFTVYKLRVENPMTNQCWLVLRRYTDFVRLNSKLKQAFQHITLILPRKKIFGDNFNAIFLDNRVQGLQMFVNSIMSKEELRKCKMVREFFCLDEPPSYIESMEECRAIFEAQDDTIAHLKLQISSKNEIIMNLQQKLREEIIEKEQLKETIKSSTSICLKCAEK